MQDNEVEKPKYGRKTEKISKKHSLEDKDNYEDWLENELSIVMVDENILEKVRNKTIVHEVDNPIYLDEVACFRSILEDILNKIINRGDNKSYLAEVSGDMEVHLLEDGQDHVMDEHHVLEQGLPEVVVIRVALKGRVANNSSWKEPMDMDRNTLSARRFKVMSERGLLMIRMNHMESLANIIIDKEEHMNRDEKVKDEMEYVARQVME